MKKVRENIYVKITCKSFILEVRVVLDAHGVQYLNAFNRLTTQSLSINAKIEEEDQV